MKRRGFTAASTLVVRRTLNELAARRAPLTLHAGDGTFIGTAELLGLGVKHIALDLHTTLQDVLADYPPPWSATCTSQHGMVQFMVPGPALRQGDHLQLPWPLSLSHQTTRRHGRLQVTAALHGKVEIVRPADGGRWAVDNLSEEGAGLLLQGHHGPDSGHMMPVDLMLDGERLPVAQMQLVYRASAGASSPGKRLAGFRLLGMTATHQASLREWLAAAAALPPATEIRQPPGSVRSNR